jgi:membrane associated rhomboid family serine protease
VGASGAIFGLLGAFFVIARNSGTNTTGLLVMIALNLGIGLFFRTISWQAHIGGLIAGALVALIFVRTPRRAQRNLQITLLVALTALLLLISFWPAISGSTP